MFESQPSNNYLQFPQCQCHELQAYMYALNSMFFFLLANISQGKNVNDNVNVINTKIIIDYTNETICR